MNHFNLTKIFVLILFKIAVNQTEFSMLEQKSVAKNMVAEKCKKSEIVKCTEMYVSLKQIYKWVRNEIAIVSLNPKVRISNRNAQTLR